MKIVLRVCSFVVIGFLVLGRKVQTLYFVYIACAGERLLLLVVECRERSGRNNRSDLTSSFGAISGGIQSKVVHDTVQKMTGLSWKLSYGFQLEEEGRWDGLFHTRVVVQERSCAMTIDHMSLINAASIEMVEKLELPMTPRPQPYSFCWGHEELSVTHQTKVPFFLGKYFCEVLCDVIPVLMI